MNSLSELIGNKWKWFMINIEWWLILYVLICDQTKLIRFITGFKKFFQKLQPILWQQSKYVSSKWHFPQQTKFLLKRCNLCRCLFHSATACQTFLQKPGASFCHRVPNISSSYTRCFQSPQHTLYLHTELFISRRRQMPPTITLPTHPT